MIQITGDYIVESGSIIGIFDFDNCTTGKRTLPLLKRLQEEGRVEGDLYSLPRSFMILQKEKEDVLVLSATTAATIRKRLRKYPEF